MREACTEADAVLLATHSRARSVVAAESQQNRTSMVIELWQSAGHDLDVAAMQLGGVLKAPSATAVKGLAAVCE